MKLTHNTLIDLASYLDEQGLVKEANEVDRLFYKIAVHGMDFEGPVRVRGEDPETGRDKLWSAEIISRKLYDDPLKDLNPAYLEWYSVRYTKPPWEGVTQVVNEKNIYHPTGAKRRPSGGSTALKAIDAKEFYWDDAWAHPVDEIVEFVEEIPGPEWAKVLALDILGLTPFVGAFFDSANVAYNMKFFMETLEQMGNIPTLSELDKHCPMEGGGQRQTCVYVAQLLKVARYAAALAVAMFSAVTDVMTVVAQAATGPEPITKVIAEAGNFSAEFGAKALKWGLTSSLTYSAIAVGAIEMHRFFSGTYNIIDKFYSTSLSSGASMSQVADLRAERSADANLKSALSFMPDKGTYEAMKNWHLSALLVIGSATDDYDWARFPEKSINEAAEVLAV